jgi:hypothetical protein
VTYGLTALSPDKEAYKKSLQLSSESAADHVYAYIAKPCLDVSLSREFSPEYLAHKGRGFLATPPTPETNQPASPARSQEQNELMGIQSERSRQESQPKRTQPLPTYRPPPTAVDRSSSENLVQTIRPRLLSGQLKLCCG